MRERRVEDVHAVLAQEELVRHVAVRESRRVEHGARDGAALDELYEAREDDALQLEPALVVRVREYEEDVLQKAEVEA
jgi:hypothetical protein